MTGINPIGGAPALLPSTTAPAGGVAPATTPAPPPPPIFDLAFSSGIGLANALGLTSPGAQGNAEAIFLEIASKLEQEKASGEKDQRVTKMESRRSDYASAASILDTLANFQAIIESNENNIKAKQAEITQLGIEREPLAEDLAVKTSRAAALTAGITSESGRVTSLTASITAVDAALLITPPGAVRDALIAERNSLIAQRNSASANVTAYSNELAALNPLISTLQAAIAEIDGKIGAANAAIAASTSEIGRQTQNFLDFTALLLPLAMGLLIGLTAETMRESGQNPRVTRDFDKLAEEALNSETDSAAVSIDYEGVRGKTLDSTGLDPGRADRVSLRFANFVSSVQAIFAGLDTLGAMADLATGANPSEGNRTRVTI